MAKGQKLDLNMGAKFDNGWSFDGDTFREKNTTKKEIDNTIKDIKEHRLVFRYEKRRGKDVTLVGEFFLEKVTKDEILKYIKKKLGVGGSIKDNWFEFQGKVDDKIRPLLEEKGLKFKK